MSTAPILITHLEMDTTERFLAYKGGRAWDLQRRKDMLHEWSILHTLVLLAWYAEQQTIQLFLVNVKVRCSSIMSDIHLLHKSVTDQWIERCYPSSKAAGNSDLQIQIIALRIYLIHSIFIWLILSDISVLHKSLPKRCPIGNRLWLHDAHFCAGSKNAMAGLHIQWAAMQNDTQESHSCRWYITS